MVESDLTMYEMRSELTTVSVDTQLSHYYQLTSCLHSPINRTVRAPLLITLLTRLLLLHTSLSQRRLSTHQKAPRLI